MIYNVPYAIYPIAAFGVAGVVGLASVTPVLAQNNNMTMGGNMTGGNMTDANTQTGNISGCGNECF